MSWETGMSIAIRQGQRHRKESEVRSAECQRVDIGDCAFNGAEMRPVTYTTTYTKEQIADWLDKQAGYCHNRVTEAKMDGDEELRARRFAQATQLSGLAGFVRENGLESL